MSVANKHNSSSLREKIRFEKMVALARFKKKKKLATWVDLRIYISIETELIPLLEKGRCNHG